MALKLERLPLPVLMAFLYKLTAVEIFRVARTCSFLWSVINKYRPRRFFTELKDLSVSISGSIFSVRSDKSEEVLLRFDGSTSVWFGLSQPRFGSVYWNGGSLEFLRSQKISCRVLVMEDKYLSDVPFLRDLLDTSAICIRRKVPFVQLDWKESVFATSALDGFKNVLIDGYLPTFHVHMVPSSCVLLEFSCKLFSLIPMHEVADSIFRLTQEMDSAPLGFKMIFHVHLAVVNLLEVQFELHDIDIALEEKKDGVRLDTTFYLGEVPVHVRVHSKGCCHLCYLVEVEKA